MAVTDYLTGKRVRFSFELTPPSRGKSLDKLIEAVQQLKEFAPAFIDVTYHQQEIRQVLYQGRAVERPVRKNPGTIGICTALRYKFNVETVPHLICGGFTAEETEDALIELHHLDFETILAVRGDAQKGQKIFIPKEGGHLYASDLVEQIANMNRGEYLDENIENAVPTAFCIGVGAYPECHPESSGQEADLRNQKLKVEKGADYMVTQIFFDVDNYTRFVKRCRETGITVPIIPGMKVIDKPEQIEMLPKIFGCSIPQELAEEIKKHKDNSRHVKQIGIEYAISQCRQLITLGVPDLHFYVFNSPRAVAEVMRRI